MATDWDQALTGIQNWVRGGSGLTDVQVLWGEQDTERPPAPAIIMRISNISELGPTWLDYEDNPHTFADITVTADATTNEFTAAAHERQTGDGPTLLEGADLPGNTDDETEYWIVVTGPNTFKLAASFQDAMAASPITVDLADAGSGTIKLVDTENTLRAGEESLAVSRGMIRMTVELRCHGAPVVGPNMGALILQRVRTRREWPSQIAILEAVNVSCQDIERIRALTTGKRDDFLFEPRAVCEAHLCMAIEESEYLTIIERVLGTNQVKDPDEDFEVP